MARTWLLTAISLCTLCGTVGKRDLFAQASVPPGVPCAADQKHEIFTHKGEHPLPAPSANKALIVVIFGSHFGQSYQHKIAVDHRRWVAVTVKSQYTFFEAEPGTLTLSYYIPQYMGARYEGFLKDMQMEVEANHAYFLRETIGDISQVSEQEVRSLLPKLEYATFAAKGSIADEDWVRRNTKFLEAWRQLRRGMTIAEIDASFGTVAFYIANGSSKEGFPTGTGQVGACGHEFFFENNLLQSWR